MKTTPSQPEREEANLQERPIETVSDESLPAAQVLHEQGSEMEELNTPRFIP
jgi:hypothetical protein